MTTPFHRARRLLAGVCLLLATAVSALADSPKLSPKVNDLIARFFAPSEFQSAELSPTGTHLAFFREVNGRHVMATCNIATTKLKLTDPALDQAINSFYWAGPDQLLYLYFRKLASPYEPYIYLSHWLANADLTHTVEIPRVWPLYEMVDPLPTDSTKVLLAQVGVGYALLRYDPTNNTTQVVEKNPGHILHWLTDTAGRARLAIGNLETSGLSSYLYRETEQTQWLPLPLPAHAEVLCFDGSDQRLLLVYPAENGRFVLQPFDLVTRKLIGAPLSDPDYDVSPAVLRDPRTGAPCGLRYFTDKPKFIWFDPQYKQLHATLSAALPGYMVNPVGLTQSGEILVQAFADVSPNEYYLFNPKTGQLRLFLDQRPQVRALTLAPMQPVEFKTADGTQLHGYLTRPPKNVGSKPLPLIALVHGGPHQRDTWGYSPEVQYYAALGYAVLQINYRGSIGYGRDFLLKDFFEVGQRSVSDIADSLKWAVREGIADPKRLIVCGRGYGGYVALGIATRHPELPAGVIGYAGTYDWEFIENRDRDLTSEFYPLAANYYPHTDKDYVRYRAISPVHQADTVKTPVLLLLGRQNTTIEIAQSVRLADALKKANKPFAIEKDTEEATDFSELALRRKYYETVTAFLLKYAPPDPAP